MNYLLELADQLDHMVRYREFDEYTFGEICDIQISDTKAREIAQGLQTHAQAQEELEADFASLLQFVEQWIESHPEEKIEIDQKQLIRIANLLNKYSFFSLLRKQL